MLVHRASLACRPASMTGRPGCHFAITSVPRRGRVRAMREGQGVKLSNITIDCADVLLVARFWSAVLERPLEERSSEYFASIGGTDPGRSEPAWYFAKVPEAKQAKNRVHVDVTTPDPDAVTRLLALGATVIGEHEVPGGSHRWTVMQDPEGNEFCVAAKAFTGWT